jgi:hypothetical protein
LQQLFEFRSISTIKTKFEQSQTFSGSYSDLIEIGSFVSSLISSSLVTTQATAVQNAMGQAIVYAWADSSSGNYYGAGSTVKKGLTIVGKYIYGGFPSFYSTTYLDFATSTGWRQVLDSWY